MWEHKIRIVALIPARRGSIGLPRKNLLPLGGLPIVTRAIRVAKLVKAIDLIAVTSDDPEVLEIARSEGVVAIERPGDLSGGKVRIEDAVCHAVDALAELGHGVFDCLCLLEPTSPLRRADTVSKCIDKYLIAGADALLTIVPAIENFGTITSNGIFSQINPHTPRRRQDREPLFKESGVVYLRNIHEFLEDRRIVPDAPLGFIVSPEEAVDINTAFDFAVAKAALAEIGDPLDI